MYVKIIIGIILVVALAVYFVGNYFYNYAIKRSKKDYIQVFSELNNADPNAEEKAAVYAWAEQTAMEETRLTAFDGIELYGQIGRQPKETHKWVVCVHGYACTGRSMYKFAKRFYEQGFSFVLPDCRGHGKSGGEYMGMGWHDRLDILKWIDKILELDPDAEILLFGVSMGAATIMMTAGETLPQNVKCVVEDCGYTSAEETFASVFQREFPKLATHDNILYKMVFRVANFICRLRAKYDMTQASALKQVQKAKVPMLFIHGTADNFVPYTMVYELYEAANCEKEIMVVEGAGHIKANEVGKESYWDKLFRFVNEHV